MRTERLPQKIAKNTIFSFIGTFWMMGISVLLTPYIIYKIGLEKFGVWAISSSIVGFLGLFNLGTSNTYTKYIAEHCATPDVIKINQTVNTGLVINILLGLCMSLVLFFVTPIINFFKFNPAYFNEVYFVVFVSIVIFIVVFISGVFNSIIEGMQRIDITNKINIFISVLNAVGVIIVLQYGWGLKGLVVNSGIIIVIAIIIRIICSRYLFPSLKLSIGFVKLDSFKKIISYGSKIQVSRIANFVNGQVDKIFLGHFLSVLVVGYYDIGAKLTRLARQILLAMYPAIMPAASELNNTKDQKRLHLLYMRGSKYLSIITIPLLLFVFTTAPIIISSWMGKGYNASVTVIRFLIVGFCVNALTGIGTSIARGIGKPEIETRYTTLVAFSNITLSLILIIKIGLIGALIGTSVSLVIFSVYFMLIFHKKIIKESYVEFAKKIYYKPFFISLILCIVVGALNLALERFFNLQNRLDYLATLLLDMVIFGPLCLFFLFKVKYLEINEVKLLFKSILT